VTNRADTTDPQATQVVEEIDRPAAENGRTPYGFKLASDNRRRLVPEPREQAAIEIMCRMRGDGATYGEIAEALWRAGFRTRKGTPICSQWIYSILKREGVKKGTSKQVA
jgi:hypothetical protein